ncbi:flavin reductase family protein [Mesorhizobium sp. CU2]|uniref:flavin reductase family protein n=1 Tax=unclassified Mesorhizobium TaxID=325217 RepID=UPI001129D7E5|nr:MULTISPECIES: flavin reductase family protein [unclassified Mesorhizobium]TPN81144.1 flavin reductase family protein [Mesorhizobium sp. CU3]TPO17057.1 flavin reductase family protein [Mesorhizobium sp. CU2]
MNAQVINSRQFRDALSHFASGITIIASMIDGKPVGFTCQAFYSVSVEPPMVSFSVMKSSTSWPKIRQGGRFCVNVLSGRQVQLSDTFAKSAIDRWADVVWNTTEGGNPVIEGTLLWLDCRLHAEHEAGDHWVIIAEVNQIGEPRGDEHSSPLLYYRGRYHQLATG